MNNLYIQDGYICQTIEVHGIGLGLIGTKTIKYKVNLNTGLLEEVE